MKFLLTLLALALTAGVSLAADPGPSDTSAPILLAQAARRDNAVTSINDRGATDPAAPAADDTFAIPASSAGSRGAARPAPAASDPSSDSAENLWQIVKKGGWAMYVLGALSILTVMLVLVFLFTMRRGAILTPHYMNTADVLLKKRDYLGLLAISSRHTETVARVVQRTLDFATKNPSAKFEVIQEIAMTEGSAQAAAIQHRVTYLADIGVLSPMVGLLGTVVGIIRAFSLLGRGDSSVSRDIVMASGVSEALVATATGLILGITAMGFYALFRNRAQALISDMEIATSHIMALLALAFAKKRETSRVPVEEEF